MTRVLFVLLLVALSGPVRAHQHVPPADAPTPDAQAEPAPDDGLRRVPVPTEEPEAPQAPAEPILRIDFPETEAIPGQALSLRLTVLVPTFMPKPPVWPTFEAPNLMVRLPERSTNPTSETIDGDTWSGVTRHYRIAPMVPGDFTIPPQELRITWNDPAGGPPVETALQTEALAFAGIVPPGGEGLDPFIAATGLTLTQEVSGTPEAMAPGDSLVRSVVAETDGLSPMFLPPLTAAAALPGLAAYPDEPVLSQTDNRGNLSGSRTEQVTFVAEGGGSGDLPGISLQWFNIDTGAVETASLDPVAYNVDGPPAALAEPEGRRRLSAALGAALLAVLGLGFLALRLRPRLSAGLAARRAAYLASEAYAWKALQAALQQRDIGAFDRALERWAALSGGADPRALPQVDAALCAIGAARFGPRPGADPGAAWSDLTAALTGFRRHARQPEKRGDLPPLNPVARPAG